MMNSQQIGGKISKYGNFTIRNGGKLEDVGPDKTKDPQKCLKEVEPSQGNENCKGGGNWLRRAPLGEFALNVLHNKPSNILSKEKGIASVLSSNGLTSNATIGGISSTEAFEVYTENEGGEENTDRGEDVKEQRIAKKRSLEEEEGLLTDNNRNENIEPALVKLIEIGKHDNELVADNSSVHGNAEEVSSSEEDEDCPSEYMTAHCSLKSAGNSQITLNTKNPIYSSYDTDIYKWMLYRERGGQSRNYMKRQSEVNEEMRAVLIDWFVDVVAEFELSPATFFLAVSLTDRTLSFIDCPREKLQLLGGTSILLASKIHEIFPPSIKDIVYVTDDSYTEDQIQRMEKIILKATDFQLGYPLVDSFAEFFDHFSSVPLNKLYRHMMWYLLELATLDFRSIHFLPSRLAAAAFLIAFCIQKQITGEDEKEVKRTSEMVEEGKEDEGMMVKRREEGQAELLKFWSEEMEGKTRIRRGQLAEPARTLLCIHNEAQTHNARTKAVRKKFSAARRDNVVQLKLPNFLR